MEDLRHGEELQALERWKRILSFCKEVILIIFYIRFEFVRNDKII